MITSDVLPELRLEMRITEDVASERDYMLEAAGPSDRLLFQAAEEMTLFLWVYVELFTRLGVRLPFTDFQREVMMRCRVAASQLHLNGWGFLRTFERKKRRRKVSKSSPEEVALGVSWAWEHKVNPIDRVIPVGYDFWAALDSGLTQGLIREILGPVFPEQLVGTVGIENAFAAKVGLEKELAATKDQVDVLTAERDSTLAAPLLKAKIDSLTEELRLIEVGRFSALARMKDMEKGAKENKKVESLTQSLEQNQMELDEAEAVAGHWREEWKALAEETWEMVQETFDILMDPVRHLHSAIDYSMITLDTCWDPKAKRIYNPKAEIQEQSEPAAEDQPEPMAEEKPEVLADGRSEQQVEETVAGEGGECPT
ncbi:hypothetical protein PIB30_079308 [Stylosanthes scabra]|uniref:Uncharacterized protein n=1 Tax=Stylosanthes scabra TaxID=79078 RepID=A0ABU6YTT5_9FABA|nr:hypothetical protein [Stylosanthes scabra]